MTAGVYDTPPPPPVLTTWITGVTITLRLTVVAFHVISTFVYDIVYVPSIFVLTDPVAWNDPVAAYVPVRVLPDQSTVSIQEAHCSVYDPLCVTYCIAAPTSVTTGGVASGRIITLRVRVLPVFPAASIRV